MSRSVNKIILVGNVGRDPDIQQTKNGTKVAHLSLATNRRLPAGDEPQERTDWHRLTLWNRLAQFAEDYVRTGDRIYIEGRLEYDSYERDGVNDPHRGRSRCGRWCCCPPRQCPRTRSWRRRPDARTASRPRRRGVRPRERRPRAPGRRESLQPGVKRGSTEKVSSQPPPRSPRPRSRRRTSQPSERPAPTEARRPSESCASQPAGRVGSGRGASTRRRRRHGFPPTAGGGGGYLPRGRARSGPPRRPETGSQAGCRVRPGGRAPAPERRGSPPPASARRSNAQAWSPSPDRPAGRTGRPCRRCDPRAFRAARHASRRRSREREGDVGLGGAEDALVHGTHRPHVSVGATRPGGALVLPAQGHRRALAGVASRQGEAHAPRRSTDRGGRRPRGRWTGCSAPAPPPGRGRCPGGRPSRRPAVERHGGVPPR